MPKMSIFEVKLTDYDPNERWGNTITISDVDDVIEITVKDESEQDPRPPFTLCMSAEDWYAFRAAGDLVVNAMVENRKGGKDG